MTARARPQSQPLDTVAEVETPEHIRFHHQLAGPARRALAYLIDIVVRAAILFFVVLVGVIGGISAGEAFAGASLGVVALVAFAFEWGYYVFCETVWSGRSPGKRALQLRVVTDSGRPLHFLDSVLRNLLRAADFLPWGYALGMVVMGRDDKFRRLGDLVAGTMIVVEERHHMGEPLVIHPPPSPQELGSLPQRLPLSGEDLDALELFLRRAMRLHPARVEELADMVAPVFARRLGVRFRGDPYRFLAILYHRAREGTYGAAAAQRASWGR